MKQIIVLGIIAMLSFFPIVAAETVGTISFGIEVQPCMDTTIEEIETNFGTVQAGKNGIIEPSFVINNTNSTCNISISAIFTTNVSATYGFVNGGVVIPGENFAINGEPLNSTGESVGLSPIISGTTMPYNVTISIPVGTGSATYNGTIELIMEMT